MRGAGDGAITPTLSLTERVDVVGSCSRDLHVANQGKVPGEKGSFARAAQIWKDPSEKNFRAIIG